ncbi:hypothetical protein ABEU84_00005, partial [Aeribacillus composti]
AEISNLNASKINAGILNTALVTIQGANGRMKIANNRLQVFANKTDGSLYERVSLGDVNGDGSVYGLRIRGADGQTVLLDENGVKREGITDGSITNEKIANDANISGTKLDIASVVTEINEGTTTIQSSKIFYNGKTLDVQLGNMVNTVNAQGQTITNHQTRITATEQGLATKVSVSQYQQDQAALSSQLSQMSTQIQQQANQIALKADAVNVYTKSQIDGQFTTVNTQISNLSAQLSVQAGQIATKVSRTEFESLQIGGRNLLTNTESWETTGIVSNSAYGIFKNNLNDLFASLLGKEVTFSFEVKIDTTDGTPGQVRLYCANGSPKYTFPQKVFSGITNQYQRVTYTTTITEISGNSGQARIEFWGIDPKTTKIYIRYFKLEKGNRATDWTPAPEDVQGQIDGLGTRVSSAETSITQLSNQIQLKANQSTVDTLTGQVSSLQAQLTVQAGQIATKVEKNGVISAINQTAEQIKIQASKVDLTGYVTFTNLSTPGQTTIDGGNLKTGSITADKLNVTSIDAISANLGTVTAGTINGVTIYSSRTEVLRGSDIRKYKITIDSGSILTELEIPPTGANRAYTSSAELVGNELKFIAHRQSLTGTTLLDVNTSIHQSGALFRKSVYDSSLSQLVNTHLRLESDFGTSHDGYVGHLFGGLKFLRNLAEVHVINYADNALGSMKADAFYFRYIRGNYNDGNVLVDHNNGNVTLSALGGVLYVGYYNTNEVRMNVGGSNTHIFQSDGGIIFGGNGRVLSQSTTTYIQGDTEIRATKFKSSTLVPMRAASFPTGSLAEYKQDIHPWEESALEKIRQATIYEYYLKSELEQGVHRKRQGLVIGEGYNTPSGVIDGDGVEQYLMNSWSWKAIQELDTEQRSMKERIAWLELENQYLKQKVKQLEEKIA